MRVGVIAAAWEIAKKDARIEMRTREIVSTAGVFSIVVGFLASLAFQSDQRANASTAAMISVIELPLVALVMFLFQIDFTPKTGGPSESVHVAAFAGMLVLGTLALALIGTLFGAMTVRTRARDLVLAIVLFPLLSPVLVCGVVGTRKAFEVQPLDVYEGFIGLMGVFVFVGLAAGVGLFGALVDD